MRYLKVADDASVADIEAGISELRRRQRQCVLAITVAGLEADLEELWDRRAIALMEPEQEEV